MFNYINWAQGQVSRSDFWDAESVLVPNLYEYYRK